MMLTPLAAFPLGLGLYHAAGSGQRPLAALAGAFLGLSAALTIAAFAAYAMLVQVASEYDGAPNPINQAFAEDGEVLAGLFVILQQAAYSALGAATMLLAWMMARPGVFPRWFAWVTGVMGLAMLVYFLASPLVHFGQPAWLIAMGYLMYQRAAAAGSEAPATAGGERPARRSPFARPSRMPAAPPEDEGTRPAPPRGWSTDEPVIGWATSRTPRPTPPESARERSPFARPSQPAEPSPGDTLTGDD
jgi:hypothetical protein